MTWSSYSRARLGIVVVSALGVAAIMGVSAVRAAPAYVTPDVIFGSGNDNGSFTIDRENHVELGLRAKQRFPAANIFNYDGGSTYTFSTGESSPGSGRPLWNFEWSINTNFDGSGANLSAFTFQLSLDTDPGLTDDFTVNFDPINGPNPPSDPGGLVLWDHAFGDNSTGNGGGVTASGATVPDLVASYLTLVDTKNVAQNSWAFSWYAPINPNIKGTYGIRLTAYDGGGNQVASTEIHVEATPIPPSLVLMISGLAVLGIATRWKSKSTPAT